MLLKWRRARQVTPASQPLASQHISLTELADKQLRDAETPRPALCVSRHMQAIALHPDASPVLRDICVVLHGAWTSAGEGTADRGPIH